MAETIILDPSAVAVNRTQLDITAFVAAEGVDWGDADIQAALADQTIGSSRVSYRIPNREITLPLRLRVVGGTSFASIRTNLQHKVAIFQSGRGWLMRQVGSTPLYADVIGAKLHLGGSWLQAYRSADVDAVLSLTALPDWYGAEVTLGSHSETTLPELIFTEATVNGNYPARTRVVVTNGTAVDQHGLLWGFRSRNYGTAMTERLAYEAEALQPLDAGTKVARASASGGTIVRHPSLPADTWCPVLSTNIGGTAFMTHRGNYRVWARAYSGTATPQLRFLYDVGDLTNPTENAPTIMPAAGGTYALDLGSIRLEPPGGDTTCRWQGVVQAKCTRQGDQIELDRLWFQPLDEGSGKLTAVQTDSAFGIFAIHAAGSAADSGASPPSAGTVVWSNPTGVIAEDSNPAYTYPSIGIGDYYTHWLVSSQHGFALPTDAVIAGIKVDVKRSCATTLGHAIVDSGVRLVKGGTVQATDRSDAMTPWPFTSAWKTYGSASDLWGGSWTGTDINNSGFGVAVAAHLMGLSGSVYDQAGVDAVKVTVYYTTLGGFTTTADAVIYASRTAELRTAGMVRQDAGGSALGPIASIIGPLPRLPVSGLESRPVEVFLKASRGNFNAEADSAIDDLSAQIFYRPCFLFVGE